MPKFTYRGNPGYEFILPDRVIAPAPGDEVELSADEAKSLGAEFESTKTKTASADKKES